MFYMKGSRNSSRDFKANDCFSHLPPVCLGSRQTPSRESWTDQGRSGTQPCSQGVEFCDWQPPQSHATEEATLSKQKQPTDQYSRSQSTGLLLTMTESPGREVLSSALRPLSFLTGTKGLKSQTMLHSVESQESQTLHEIQGQSWVRTFKVPKQLPKVQRPTRLTGFMGHVIDKPNNHVS